MALNFIHSDVPTVHIPLSLEDLSGLKSLFLLSAPFAPASSSTSSDIEEASRPVKRRRLDSDDTLEALNDGNSALLASVKLDLHFAASDAPHVASHDSKDAHGRPIAVELTSLSQKSKDSVSLTLFNVAAQAQADIEVPISDEHHLRILQDVHTLGRKIAYAKRPMSTRLGACFGRCLLSQSPQNDNRFSLVVEIRWLFGVSIVESAKPSHEWGKQDLMLLARYFPQTDDTRWSLYDFYDAVHAPDSDIKIASQIAQSLSETMLYPFQQRAVDWLLRREGVAYPPDGGSLTSVGETPASTVSFKQTHDAGGRPVYISHVRATITSDPEAAKDNPRTLRGGILAEEMGLGKTVELIALMCLHKRTITEGTVLDEHTNATLTPTGATLIITPPSLIEQWNNEINTHAPHLKVYIYRGIPQVKSSKQAQSEASVDHLLKYDVVLTTYAVLSREIHFAKPPPDRSMRHGKKYEPRRSPLVDISWWRVCLDEAQMVESGVSNAATVARIIPRCNAWAVSGTPLKKNLQDLQGLLRFLRYEPFAESKALWNRLDKSTFKAIFSQIALRHTKDRIRDELRLPQQKRVVITVPFTAIEQQNYTELFEQMCEVSGLSEDGHPLGSYTVDHPAVLDSMRKFLLRLRLTCLHPHVGRGNRRALGGKNAPLRTIHEVLEVMIDQNDTSKKSEARELISTILRRGHTIANDGSNERRSIEALPFYERALELSQNWVETCRKELAEAKLMLSRSGTEGPEDDEDNEDQDIGRVPAIRKSLRTFLELEHASKFFIGNSYYQIKSNPALTQPDSDEFQRLDDLETDWYERAKAVRKEVLQGAENKVRRQVDKVRKSFPALPRIFELPDLGGIEFRKILDMMDDISELLDRQAVQIEKWRTKIIDILLLPLVDEDKGKDTTGDEYEDSTKVQDELYVYIMALRTLVAERNAAVNGLHDALTAHELDEAERKARRKEGHAPELVLEVADLCRKLTPPGAIGSLKGIVSAARSLLTNLQFKADGGDFRAAAEFEIVQKQFASIRKISDAEKEVFTELEKQQELFRAGMNERLEFYRQLQRISDTVAPWREQMDNALDQDELTRQTEMEQKVSKRLDEYLKKHIYLLNLRESHEGPSSSRTCLVCMDEIEIGVLTKCGHEFCKECLQYWWAQKRNCPICKSKLRNNELTDITYKPQIKAQEETPNGPSQASSPSSHTSIYSDISASTMKEIKMIDLDGSYGSKIDMIARHLLWIRGNDPGSKTVIFSQFGDFLEVLRHALRTWKIGCSSIADKNGITRFRTDPAVECFLLDARSDSSGLNLVNATYVFLCEPLINPAIELQAIARVHRIGQRRPTTVIMYLVSDTVEEAIYDISVARRLEHMGRGNSASSSRSGTATPALQEKNLEAANSMELEAAPVSTLLRKKGEGELVQKEDVWLCLFGRAWKLSHHPALTFEMNRQERAEAAERRRLQSQPG